MKNLTFLTAILLFVFSYNGQAQPQNGLRFDGFDDYVQTTYPGITGNNARTVEAWVKLNGRPSLTHRIVSWGGNGGSLSQSFMLMVDATGVVAISQGITANTLYGTADVSDSQWHHIAVTFNAYLSPSVTIYVDGQADTSYNFATSVNTRFLNPVKLGVGSRPVTSTTSNFYAGYMDEVRIWDHARSPAQIDSFYDQEICANHSGLVAYYRFNHGVADSTNTGMTRLYDHSSDPTHGTLTNFSLHGAISNWTNGAGISDAPDSDTSFTVEACDSYLSPAGRTITTSQVITDTIQNAVGCDSVLTIDVTVNSSWINAYSKSACDSFVSYSGLHTWRSSGTYDEVFTNSAGCDSIYRYMLTIEHNSYNKVIRNGCDTYTSPSGNHTWTQSGIYMDTLYTPIGCDSILEIDLRLHDVDSTETSLEACDSYTTSDGRILTTSGTYYETQNNRFGCDSVITLDLSIQKSAFTTLSGSGCDSFTSYSGMNTWHSTGTYHEIQTAHNGCDSTIEYDVTIHGKVSTPLSVSACGSYLSPTGKLYTASGSYRDTLATVLGCDSILRISLNLTVISAEISESQGQLRAYPSGKQYQWLDCTDNYAPIEHADGQVFVPASNGSYAVAVKQNACSDTSDCYVFQLAGVQEESFHPIKIHPNPTMGSLTIATQRPGVLYIQDIFGHRLQQLPILGPTVIQLQLDGPPGLYFIEFQLAGKGTYRYTVVKL